MKIVFYTFHLNLTIGNNNVNRDSSTIAFKSMSLSSNTSEYWLTKNISDQMNYKVFSLSFTITSNFYTAKASTV